MSSMTDVPWDSSRTVLSALSFEVFIAAYRVAGMMSEAHATAMREDMVLATVLLKLRSCSRMPPAMKQQPRT